MILALSAYLGLLDNPQMVFGVKQRTPNLDAAEATTPKLESYLSHKAVVSTVKEEKNTDNIQIGTVTVSNDKLITLMEKLTNGIERLEVGRSEGTGIQITRRGCQENGGARRGWKENEINTPTCRAIICWNCGKRRHIARLCKSPSKKLQES